MTLYVGCKLQIKDFEGLEKTFEVKEIFNDSQNWKRKIVILEVIE